MASDLSSNPAATGAGSPAPGGAVPAGSATATPQSTSGAWSPLAIPIFRALWIGYVLSQIGTSAREAGAQWLMTSLVKDPHERASWLGLIQTSFYLPICALSIAAGVW